MNRITFKNTDGTWGANGINIAQIPKVLHGAMCKLRDYENTRLEPSQVEDLDRLYREKCEEVARLREEIRTGEKPDEGGVIDGSNQEM